MSKFTSPLDNVHVASPCKADWNKMVGDERQRHCAECKLNVYNLSGMTRPEAERLLMNSEGNLCVRFYRRTDGTILTKDCPVGWRAIKRNAARVATGVFSLIAGLFGGLFAFNSSTDSQNGGTFCNFTAETPVEKDYRNTSTPKKTQTPTMGTPVPMMGNFTVPRNETTNSEQKRTRRQ